MTYYKAINEPIATVGTGRLQIIEGQHDITNVQYTEEFDYLMAGCVDGAIRAIDKKNKLAFTLQDEMTSRTTCTGMKHRPLSKNYPISNTFMCTYANGLLKCWNYNFKECVFTTDEKRFTTGIAFSPRNNKFVTYGDNKKIYLYDEDSKRQERVLSKSDENNATNGHTGTITSACFHPRNVNELISAGLDHTLQFWDTRQANAMRQVCGVTVIGPGLEFTPKGTEFITCSHDGKSGATVRIWDYASGKEMSKFELDKFKTAPCFAGTFINRSSMACGGGPPNFIRIFDVATGKSTTVMSGLATTVKGISTGSDSAVFACCGGNRIYIYTAT